MSGQVGSNLSEYKELFVVQLQHLTHVASHVSGFHDADLRDQQWLEWLPIAS